MTHKEVLDMAIIDTLEYMLMIKEQEEDDYNNQVDRDIKLFHIVRYATLSAQPTQSEEQARDVSNSVRDFMAQLEQYTGLRSEMHLNAKLSEFQW